MPQAVGEIHGQHPLDVGEDLLGASRMQPMAAEIEVQLAMDEAAGVATHFRALFDDSDTSALPATQLLCRTAAGGSATQDDYPGFRHVHSHASLAAATDALRPRAFFGPALA
jgi:hypothetical protein